MCALLASVRGGDRGERRAAKEMVAVPVVAAFVGQKPHSARFQRYGAQSSAAPKRHPANGSERHGEADAGEGSAVQER